MTGPEHYREAERLLMTAAAADNAVTAQSRATRAQAEATLALAAATLEAAPVDPNAIDPAWRSVTGDRS